MVRGRIEIARFKGEDVCGGGDGGLVSKEVVDGLEKNSRRVMEREVRRYEGWCREGGHCPWPPSDELLEGYGWWVVMQVGVGGGD